MGHVSITIRGRQYQIACDDGQEAHVARLGKYLDQQAEQVQKTTKNTFSDSLLLVMIGLLIADELSDASADARAAQQTQAAARAKADQEIAAAISALAQRVEDIAAKVEGS
ncbi:MAG: cell division protein ZapA [Alphaproteobacteria bacterium]|nr:cell division protein ZapA [Alphaproteobacteria bacterium]